MSIKNLLRKAAELVVEIPDDSSSELAGSIDSQTEGVAAEPKTVEQIVRESPGPNLDEIHVTVNEPTPARAPDGRVNFGDIYARAGLPQSSFSAEQALEVMSSLPAELSLEVRRKTVQATLGAMGKAMGVNTESVVADASRKLAALASYSDALEHNANTFIVATQAKIADLERQISEQNHTISETQKMLADAIAACKGESDRLDDVLEFFTSDVSPSKNA